MECRAAVVKGRSNYLCPRRLATLRRRRPTSVGELRVLAKILVWLLESDSGDKGEISLRGFEENVVWSRLSAEDEGCTLDRCGDQMHGACPFYKARRDAEAAHILIVNHALLLADVQIGNRVLPDYRYLIIDEAHHLEDATTNGLSFQLNQITLLRQLADLGDSRRGLLGDVIRSTAAACRAVTSSRLSPTWRSSPTRCGRWAFTSSAISRRCTASWRVAGRCPGEYINQVRITPELRQQPEWAHVEEAWNVLSQFTQAISNAMGRLRADWPVWENSTCWNTTICSPACKPPLATWKRCTSSWRRSPATRRKT